MAETVHLGIPSPSKMLYTQFLLHAGHCTAVAAEEQKASVVPALTEITVLARLLVSGPLYALKNYILVGLSLSVFTILEIKPEKLYPMSSFI